MAFFTFEFRRRNKLVFHCSLDLIHVVKVSFCEEHHLAGVALRVKSKTGSLFYSPIICSIVPRKSSKFEIPSYSSAFFTSVPAHWIDLTTAHLLEEISCFLFFHSFKASSESLSKEWILCQLTEPYVVVFTYYTLFLVVI